MSEVKRWAAKTANDMGSVVFLPSPNGHYVKYEDYTEEKHRADQNASYLETLTERMLAAERERDQATLTHDYLQDQINYWQGKAKEAAAENLLMIQDYRDTPALRRMGLPLTPATETILNAVRAEGVESFGNITVAIGEAEEDADIVYAGEQALLYAAKLRTNTTDDEKNLAG